MKKLSCISLFFLAILFIATPVCAQDLPNYTGSSFVQNYNWEAVGNDPNHHMILGRVGSGLRLEGFCLNTDYPDLGIQYKSHVQGVGWQDPVDSGNVSGAPGQGRNIEAVAIQLIGANAPNFHIYYRSFVQDYGWLDWTTNFGASGTTNHDYRLEAIEILITPASAGAPGSTTTPAVQATTRAEAKHMALVNWYRRLNGRSYVTGDHRLKAVADVRVKELATRFSHIRPNGLSYETAVKDVFPNYPHQGAAIIENINLARTPLMTRPEYSFAYMSTYVHQMDIILQDAARYMSWSAISTPRMGYSIELFSGLDHIDFGDY